MAHKHSDLSLEEQRLADDDAIYDRYVDEFDEEAPYECDYPGCTRIATGPVYLGLAEMKIFYCASHLDLVP